MDFLLNQNKSDFKLNIELKENGGIVDTNVLFNPKNKVPATEDYKQ